MAVEFMARVWGADLPRCEFIVLMALADQADRTGKTHPGIALLARMTRYEDRQVRRALVALEARGAIQRLSRANPKKRHATVWLLRLDCIQSDTMSTGQGVRRNGIQPDISPVLPDISEFLPDMDVRSPILNSRSIPPKSAQVRERKPRAEPGLPPGPLGDKIKALAAKIGGGG